MTRGHLLSFGRVWRNEKWREIQASISLFKFLIMEVSLRLNGWSILVFFFFLWSSVSLCICVEGEEMMWSIKKLRFDFEATNVLCCPLDRYAEKVMAIMQTYGDGQTGGGGVVKKQRFSIGSCKEIRPISYYDLEFFLTKMESLATHAPPSLSYVFEASP